MLDSATDPVNVSLTVLGRLDVQVNAQPIALQGVLKHRLLARLALSHGASVSVDSLIDALWLDAPPRTAKQAVHVHISHLRDRLRAVGVANLITTTSAGTYELGLDPGNIDAYRFATLVDDGLAAQRSGRLRQAKDLLSDALALWAEPYESLADNPGALAERSRLIALHERGVDGFAETLLELGELDEAAVLLRSTVATEPLRELPYEQLMRVYRALDEPALAASAFDMAERTFHAALGIEPSTQLRAMRDADESHRPSSRVPVDRVGVPAQLDLSRPVIMCVEHTSDARDLVEQVRGIALAQDRRVASVRLTTARDSGDSDASTLLPFWEVTGQSQYAPALSRTGAGLFTGLTDALVNSFRAGFVLVVENIENATPTVVAFLRATLARHGPDPFTLIGVHRGAIDHTSSLGPLLDHVQANTVVAGDDDVPVESMTDRLDANERLVCSLLELTIQPVPLEVIARASGLASDMASAAINRLKVRRLLDDDQHGRLSMREPGAIWDALHNSVPTEQALHLALADAVTYLDDGFARYRVRADARHRLCALPAGDHQRAWDAALEAVRFLDDHGSYREIVDLLDSVVADDWPTSHSSIELQVSFGRAQVRCGLTSEGSATLERAILLARSAENVDFFTEAVRALIEAHAPQTIADTTRPLIIEALAMMGDSPSDTRVQLLTDLANSWYFVDPERATRLADQAVAASMQAGSTTRARALTGYIQACLRPDNAARRLELALEAQRFARQADSTESLVLALTYEAHALFELGQPRRAEAPLLYAEALAADVQVPRFRWWAAAWLALLGFARGDLDQAEDRFRAAYELWPNANRSDPFECFAAQMASLRFVQGRGAEILPLLESAAVESARPAYLAALALARAQAGEDATARSAIDQLLAPNGLARCSDITLPYSLALTAEAAHMVGAKVAGPALLRLIEPLVDVHVALNVWGGGGAYWGSLRHGFAIALDLAGDTNRAAEEFARTAADLGAAGVPLFAQRATDLSR